MAVGKMGGGAIKIGVPLANDVRNISQSVENLFNQSMVDRVFEDASIPDNKLTTSFSPKNKTIRTVGIDDNLELDDNGSMILVTGEAEISLPDNFPEGFQVKIIRYTSADVSITSDTSVIYLSSGSNPIGASTLNILTESDIINIGSDEWLALGDISP